MRSPPRSYATTAEFFPFSKVSPFATQAQGIQVTGIPADTTIGASATAFNGTGCLRATTGSTAGTVNVGANGAARRMAWWRRVLVRARSPARRACESRLREKIAHLVAHPEEVIKWE
jgi:hypothetical protein